jgi:hypothetical protein
MVDTPRRRSWYRSPWFLLPTGIFVTAIASGLIWREQRLAAIPDIPEPFDVEAFVAGGVPEAQNAFTDYREALRVVREFSGSIEEQLDFLDGRPTAVPASIEAWLKANQTTLEWLRKGTSKQGAAARNLNDIRQQDFLDESPRLLRLRELSRLMGAQARALLIAGDLSGSLEWRLAQLRFGQHLTHRPSFNDWTIAYAFRAQAFQDLVQWAEHPQVTLHDVEALFPIIDGSRAACAPYSESLRSEYVLYRDYCQRFTLYYDLEEVYRKANPLPPPARYPRMPQRLEYWALHEPEISARTLKLVVANQLPFIDLPPRDRPAVFPARVCLFDHPLPSGVTPLQIERAARAARWIVGHLSTSELESIDADRLMPTLVRTAVAVCAWQKVYGELPPSLENVVDAGWLAEVPDDPMAATPQSLRYERLVDDPQRALLWSVGSDGIDQGGVPHPGDGPYINYQYGDTFFRDPDWGMRLGEWLTMSEYERLHPPPAQTTP